MMALTLVQFREEPGKNRHAAILEWPLTQDAVDRARVSALPPARPGCNFSRLSADGIEPCARPRLDVF